MHRRSLLVALGAGLAGCNSRSADSSEPQPTVTPAPLPEDEPTTGEPLAVEDSGFDADIGTPDDVQFFHELDPGFELGLVPSQERFTPSTTAAAIRLQNDRPSPLFVSSGWNLRKYTGERWVRILAPHLNRGGITSVAAESEWRRQHRITNVFSLPILGPGLYARVEDVRVNDGSIGGEIRSLGALFEVEGTTYDVTPKRPAERDGDTAMLVVSETTDAVTVFEQIEEDDVPASTVSLVPEVIGAIPLFRDAVPLLDSVSEVRVQSPSSPLTFEYLSEAPVRDVPVGPETRFEHDGVVFTVRVVDPNR
ncbi:hypothetical protein [Natronomonas sp.]|uniref:hypothetical protein n=1 Tax=Natronomonas sp. TaxID=2184060 RepID=UPI003988F89E